MFIVKSRSELMRFGLFLALVAGLVWFVLSRFDLWQVSLDAGADQRPAGGPLIAARRGEAGGSAGAAGEAVGADQPAVVGSPGPGDGGDYFAEYRIERERSRDALAERLKELMDSPSAADEVRKKASEEYLRLGETAALESRAEAMVKARGFADVIVLLAEGSAQVVVKAASLSQQEVIEVIDTVSRVTGVKSSAVTVMAKHH